MPLATNARGDKLVGFVRCGEDDVAAVAAAPMPLALVVARHRGQTALVFDRWKKVWELPGGVIEAGETARKAARRELAEETGQTPGEFSFVGLATYELAGGRVEHGAVFACTVGRAVPFAGNAEIAELRWWDGEDRIGDLDELDAAIAKLVL